MSFAQRISQMKQKRLVDLLKQSIISGQFDVFSGVLSSQDGIVQDDPERSLTPDEIIRWTGLPRM